MKLALSILLIVFAAACGSVAVSPPPSDGGDGGGGASPDPCPAYCARAVKCGTTDDDKCIAHCGDALASLPCDQVFFSCFGGAADCAASKMCAPRLQSCP